jgi:hypothetical protein
MNKKALELYLYMGSTTPIIEWLEEEGCKTVEEARTKLTPLVESNMLDVLAHIGQGHDNVSLAGTSNGITKILEHFA